jgi:orotate phosphoribosyltransferase
MRDQILKLLSARHGHFLFESGHHGEMWLDLQSLFFRPPLIQPLVVALASRMREYDVEIVCGPLVEGSFAGLLVALELGVDFVYSERFFRPTQDGLFPAIAFPNLSENSSDKNGLPLSMMSSMQAQRCEARSTIYRTATQV